MLGGKSVPARLLLIIALTSGLGACRSSDLAIAPDLPEVPFAPDLQAAIDQVFQDHLADHNLGVSAAVIIPGFRSWSGVSGNSHSDVPITQETVFDVGSIEKNFEAALVLELAAEGHLGLDDPISMYLPNLPHVDRNITIRQLLDHTSGVFNVFEHPRFPWVGTDVDYSRRWEPEEVFNTFVLDPYGHPGHVQHYSSTNYLLITWIVEEVTGNTVPTEIQRRYLEGLKLQHTFVSMGQQPTAEYSVAHAWVDIDRDGNLEDLHGIPYTWKASLTHPVMFSNASDLARWMHSLYHEQAVLDPELITEMLTYPEVSARDPEGGSYGLGVVDYSDDLGEEAVGHGGSSLGYSAVALYLPEFGTSLAWLINTGENPPELAEGLMWETWLSLIATLKRNRSQLQ
jgi:D-alanyl-D-alanine carboxypeptidase